MVGGLESVLIGLLSGSCKTASGGVSSFISRSNVIIPLLRPYQNIMGRITLTCLPPKTGNF